MDLKIGDKIYFFRYGKYPISFEKIIKKTPTLYRTKNYSLKIDGEYIRIIGKGKWDNTMAQLANKTNDDLWEEDKMTRWFDDKKFTIKEKTKVYKIFNPL